MVYGSTEKSIIPTKIKNDSEYNVRTLVLKQVDRITYMLSIHRATITGTSENFRGLGFGIKSALMSLEALISPFLKDEDDYYSETKKIKDALNYLENRYLINSRDFRYWSLLNKWLSLLIKELARLGYFPQEPFDYDEEYD